MLSEILSCNMQEKQVTATSSEIRKSHFVTEFKYNGVLLELPVYDHNIVYYVFDI